MLSPACLPVVAAEPQLAQLRVGDALREVPVQGWALLAVAVLEAASVSGVWRCWVVVGRASRGRCAPLTSGARGKMVFFHLS